MPENLSEVILILVGSTLVILMLTGLVVIALVIHQKRKFNHRHELVLMKSNYEREVLKTQLETQADTFEVVSRELHDNVGTLISIAIVQMHSIQATLPGKKVEEVMKLLEEAMDTLRDISKSADPDNLGRMGLTAALKKELGRIELTNLFQTELISSGEEFSIEPRRLIILFRIIQEAINNAIKHSGGDRIHVKSEFKGKELSLSVSDNGHGFSVDAVNPSGLLHMKKRAQLLNASLDIQSSKSGTDINIQYHNGQEIPAEKPHVYGIDD